MVSRVRPIPLLGIGIQRILASIGGYPAADPGFGEGSPAAKRFLVHFQPIWSHFGKHFQATCF